MKFALAEPLCGSLVKTVAFFPLKSSKKICSFSKTTVLETNILIWALIHYLCRVFSDFKPVLKILLRFIIIYLVMVFLYQLYLNQTAGISLDPFSAWIAEQVRILQNSLGYSTWLYHDGKQETTWFYVVSKYVTRMVEGCNAVSVMILFVAFIFAFYKGRKTFAFTAAGLVFLHVMNVLRIAALNIVIYEHEEYGKMFHDYVFPAIIYGSVVLLWLIWIKKFALKKP